MKDYKEKFFTASELNSMVRSSGHVECTSILFTAVESQLGERQVCCQLIHGGFRENHLITGYSTV